MIDPRVLTEQPDLVKTHLARRHDSANSAAVDAVVELASRRKQLASERDDLRGQRNSLSKEIGALYKQGKADEAGAMKARVAEGAERIKVLETELDELEGTIRTHCLGIPNLLHADVPEGADESGNVVVKTWGEPRTFDFEPQPHVEVGTALGILDFERATNLSGARFAILSGAAARLDRALVSFYLDTHTTKNGYREVSVPYIVQSQAAEGTGQLPKFADDMFRLAEPLNGETAYLIPTAEVPITNIHRGEILDADALPVKYAGFSPCFRSEAGSAGRDVRGLIRQHQFHKVEMVWVVEPDQAEEAHRQLISHAEGLLEALELPYRTVELCGGDISANAFRCYDLEAWMPSQNAYREVSSCSLFGDYQTRRMNLRYRPAPVDGKKQKPRYPFTLNGSGLPTGRIMVALLENHQQADGSVVIPKVLRPYMGGLDVIRPA